MIFERGVKVNKDNSDKTMSSWFKDFTDQVQSALPTFEDATGGLLQSLTLTTPELSAERQRIDDEERRKERIRNSLSAMLPWETHDPDRDILVDECKDAILLLSTKYETFHGPFELPPMKTKAITDIDADKATTAIITTPSTESLDKLAKLQPLPPLLDNFEFLAHVGLIEKILVEDPNLVHMQSTLSGGGARERVFWKNYFFHCAYTRYEAGLSIDEIWSEDQEQKEALPLPLSSSKTAPMISTTTTGKATDESEETITFEVNQDEDNTNNISTSNVENNDSLFSNTNIDTANKQTTVRTESDYEIVDDEKLLLGETSNAESIRTNDVPIVDDTEYEMDELEAEIARELED